MLFYLCPLSIFSFSETFLKFYIPTASTHYFKSLITGRLNMQEICVTLNLTEGKSRWVGENKEEVMKVRRRRSWQTKLSVLFLREMGWSHTIWELKLPSHMQRCGDGWQFSFDWFVRKRQLLPPRTCTEINSCANQVLDDFKH